jgi:hypothetical protein
MVQLDTGPHDLLSCQGDVPASRVRDLGDQPPHVETLQQSSHRGALSAALLAIRRLPVQPPANIGIVEATQEMLALQDRLKQRHVFATRGIEPRIAALLNPLGSAERSRHVAR